MRDEDTVTLRQYAATVFVALFSPMSRLLPGAAAKLAGSSGWVGPLLALLPLAGLVALMYRLLRFGDRSVGLGEALCRSLGNFPGKGLSLLLALWLVFYGGFLLRSGAERLISTVYPSASPGFFLPWLLGICALAAMGKLRYTFRCGTVILLLFSATLILIYVLALPSVKLSYLWPPRLREPGKLALSALPAMDTLSPWVYFTFLRGHVREDAHALKQGLKGIAATALGGLLLLAATLGVLGPELTKRQQYPFFIMIKNLTVFHVIQRIEPLVVTVWLMTDFICVTLVLLSAAEALAGIFPGKRSRYVMACGLGMLVLSFLVAPDALTLARLSDHVVPGINLGISFLLLPLAGLGRLSTKKSKKVQNNS
jgi:spore germination protein KB